MKNKQAKKRAIFKKAKLQSKSKSKFNAKQSTSQTTPLQSVSQKTHSKKIAIIGSGVSGLTCAHYLVSDHDVTIFEANDYLGGHVNTIDVELADRKSKLSKKQRTEHASIDTGFIVFNERTYPNFFRLLNELDVAFQKTDMSFSVKNPAIHFEYNGHTLNSLVSQRKNILSPKFWQFAKNIIDFNKHIKQLRSNYQQLEQELQALNDAISKAKKPRKKLVKQLTKQQTTLTKLSQQTLGSYLSTKQYGELFTNNYLLPMVSAIWSMGLEDAKAFPLIFFAQFFDNHGLLDIVNRPQWFTIKGGSKQYVNKLVERYASMGGKAFVNAPVQSVSRDANAITIVYKHQAMVKTAQFDEVVFACHADVAKRLLSDASEQETEVLSAFNFTNNQAILHTDTSVLPKKPLAWASWNYLLPSKRSNCGKHGNRKKRTSEVEHSNCSDVKPVLTYHMNILQRLVKRHNYLVTLNEPVNHQHIIKRIDYRHPVYDVAMTKAQKQWQSISGQNSKHESKHKLKHGHTHFCGAYWFNGFHEDGVRSGVRVCQSLGINIDLMDEVNPAHLTNVVAPTPAFAYKHIPIKADKNTGKLQQRKILSAMTNTKLNQLFTGI